VAHFGGSLGMFSEALERAGKPATGWLCWQSQANPSLLPNSLIYGKLQGISAVLAQPCPPDTDFSVLHQQEMAKFPKRQIRELFGRNKEIWN